MATPTTITYIDPTSEPALNRQALEIAASNGGVYIFETTKDIFVTSVTETVTNQTVYPSYNTIYNSPGAVSGGIQFNVNGNFSADPLLTYTNGNLNANSVNAYQLLTDNLLYANGMPWDFGEAVYGNANVANYLPNYTGNLRASNVLFTGVVNLGSIEDIRLYGGPVGQALVSSGSGNLVFAPIALDGNLSNGNSSIFINQNSNINVIVNSNPTANFTSNGLDISGNLTASSISANTVNAQVVVSNSRIALTNSSVTVTANSNAVVVVNSSGDGNLRSTGVNVAGYINATGNIISTNIIGTLANGNSNIVINGNSNVVITSGGNSILTVTPTGVNVIANLTGTNFIGNLANGTSNVRISANGNVTVSAGGTVGVLTVSNTGITVSGNTAITGNLSVTGGLSVASLTANLVSGTSNISIVPNSNVRISVGGNSNVFVVTSGGTVTAGSSNVTGNISSGRNVVVGAANANSGLVLTGASGGNLSNTRLITIYPGANISSNYALVLPNSTPSSNGQVLGANVDGQMFWTTGALTNTIINGNSNVFVTANGNVITSVAGNANVLIITGTGANITGTLSAVGNIIGGNLVTNGRVDANGDITGSNITISSNALITSTLTAGNIETGNITSNANANIAGTLIAGTISTGGNLGVTGNIVSSGNLSIVDITSTGNVVSANITTNGTATLANIVSNTTATFANITANSNVTLGNVANVHILGGTANQTLTTDGSGNLFWSGGGSGGGGTSIVNGTSNVVVILDGNVTVGAAGTANVLTVANTGIVAVGNTNVSNLTANGNVNFSSTGNVSLGSVANVKIANGSAGQALITDGTGNLSWATVGNTGVITAITNGNSQVSIPTSGGDILFSATGNANVLVVTRLGANLTGAINITGNLTANGGITSNGLFSNGNITVNNANIAVGGAGGGGVLTLTGPSGDITFNASGNIQPSGGTANIIGSLNVTSSLVASSIQSNGTVNFSNSAALLMGNISNISILGGNVSNGAVFLRTDGNGNLSWANASTTVSSLSNSGTFVNTFSNGTVTVSSTVSNGVSVTFNTEGITVAGLGNANVSAGNIIAANTVEGVNFQVATNIDAGGNATIGGTISSNGNIRTANGFFIGRFDANSNSQPNITTVGNLTGLTVSNDANINGSLRVSSALTVNGIATFNGTSTNLGPVGNVRITGGNGGQFLQTNGSGNLIWADVLISDNPPALANSNGVAGTIAYEPGFLYVCVATDTWERVALATF